MTPTLERALAIVSDAKMEQRDSGVVIFLDNTEEASLVSKIVDLYGYKPDPTEVANANTLYFVERAGLDDEDESVDDDLEEDDSEEDESDEGDEEDDSGDQPTSGLGSGDLADDGRHMRILVTQESHRFAQKIYQNMLGNENMAGYAAFLNDLDRFLNTHKGSGDLAFSGKRRGSEEASTAEGRILLNFLELMEYANAGELPWATDNADDAIVVAAVEIAKKKQKNGRAGLLSALMKAISGDAGDAAVKAWDDKDSEKLSEVLTEAVKKVSGQAGRE
jgi:hypothetical protein